MLNIKANNNSHTMITELHNIDFHNQEKGEEIKLIMSLSENLRRKTTTFKLGSDEHLDFVSAITTELNSLIEKLRDFNDSFELMFPKDKKSSEFAVNVLHILHSGLSLAIEKLKSDDHKHAFKTCLENLKTEHNQIIEYIEDINEFILSDDEENLLNDLI